ncbi:hypothetical protein KFK09_005942 [Dendrobium nobile]|uniref:Uncharacterized protein n=1 Tax=Dendrobium nobile TaxID=94219 RepID=A0A8T3BX72_DENNO|nr:hypothetical protein KFK09_005942 [Dendrobium nobile]
MHNNKPCFVLIFLGPYLFSKDNYFLCETIYINFLKMFYQCMHPSIKIIDLERMYVDVAINTINMFWLQARLLLCDINEIVLYFVHRSL